MGSKLVKDAIEASHKVRILSRQSPPQNKIDELEWTRGDLTTGENLAGAVRKIDAVVHCATKPGWGDRDTDVEGTRRLVHYAEKYGVEHVIYPSIVGVDEIPLSYYRYKFEAEQIIEDSSIPHTILRATQFHSLVNQLISTAMRLPFAALLPTDFKFQTVASAEVAEQLNKCIAQPPRGRLPNYGGPKVSSLHKMAQKWLNARDKQKKIVRLPLPGQTAKAFRRGTCTDPNRKMGHITWQEWLKSKNAKKAV